jgi:hypothetical protein
MDFWSHVDTEKLTRAVVAVNPWVLDRFTDDVVSVVGAAFNRALLLRSVAVDEFEFVPRPADENWRESLQRRLGGAAGTAPNQGRPVPNSKIAKALLSEDSLYFRSDAERRVYRALKRVGGTLPSHESILIAPNAGVRVKGTTLEVDFLVTHKGRVGAIEVDSEYHRGRRDFDKSREKLLEDAGVSYVDRIPAEDSGDDASLDEAVARFLKRLAS